MKKISYFIVLALCQMFVANAQTFDSIANRFGIYSPITRSGIFDTVFDKDGRKYVLNDLIIKNSNNKTTTVLTSSCSAGYFNLYFETGSLGNGTASQQAANQAVFCQVFSDISAFINSPLTTNGLNNRVNIWVRDIANVYSNPSGIAGSATQFYSLPNVSNTTVGGIVDGEIYKTIISGFDSYANFTSPLVSTNNSGNAPSGAFFHGMVTFNFVSGLNWNNSLTTLANNTNLDLYSVALHEVTHALGFASLINSNGFSKFGANTNYYSRYDLFLRYTNLPLITQSTLGCTNYQYQFNPALTTNVLTNSGAICTNDVLYVGSTTQPVFCPSVYSSGSSLSHFQDNCHPSTFVGGITGYVMHPGGGYGLNFRLLQPEERNVLCDLGYNVNSTYGNVSNLNFYNYGGSACSSPNVIGINDGITSGGSFSFSGNASTNINILGLLTNDYFGTGAAGATFECLQDISYSGTTLSPTFGPNATVINFSSAITGLHLLRYIPVSALGVRGNITYVYVYVQNGNCTASACNMLNNNEFENNAVCGNLGSSPSTQVDCWTNYANSPDVLTRNCTFNGAFNIPTPLSNPVSDSWSGSPNDAFLGMGDWNLNNGTYYQEGVQTLLNNPITQNGVYTLSFRARVSNNVFGSPAPVGQNEQLTFGGNVSTTPLVPIGSISSLPASLSQLGLPITIIHDNTWHYYTQTFTYSGSNNLNTFILLNTSNMVTPAPHGSGYFYIDDVKLTQSNLSVSLNLPAIICQNQPIADLSTYLTPPVVGGVFSGPGVTVSGGIYSFNPTTAGVGNHVINFSYTNNLGCVINIGSNISVVSANINVTASATPNTICAGQFATLNATGGTIYNWQPGNGSGSSISVNPGANTPYVVTVTDANGCQATASTLVTVTNCNPCSNCPNALAPTGVLSANPPANQVYCLTNNITISGNVTISQSEVKISPNVVITVPANSVLNIVGSHLYSCTDMWQGIVIEPKGSINILPYIVGNTTQKTSLIEDAEIAVDVQTGNGLTTNILTSNNATFNKNHYGIRIQGYTPNLTLYPFTVINSLFTCRDIPFTINNNTWPLTSIVKAATNPITSPLQTPYINNTTYSQSNANAFLKNPLANQKSQTAIYLNKVGNTINPGTTPTYYEIAIGTTGANNYNMFDNHLVALYGLNTNVKVVNSVFQNAITTGKAGTVGGIGIQVLSQEINNNRLQVVAANPAGIFFNKFFNCSRSILSQDYFENIIKNNDFRSTQVNPAPATTLFQPGKYGITITSCRYRAVTVTSNKLYNIENPIAFSASVGFFNVGSGNNNGQYSGQVNINSNTIRQHLAGNTVTSQYVNLGIAISNIVSISNLVLIPGTTVNANNNTIVGAYRGIGSQNWLKKDVSTNNNNITLVVQIATGTPLQYGIGSANNIPASQNNINGNIITGFNTTYNRLHGIYTSLSSGQIVNCNSTTNTYNGLTFNGNNVPTQTAYNTMGNHHYGFVLDNNGIIGQQGTPTAPCDNTYAGPFVFKTAVLNTSSPSSAVSSPMYVRATGVTNPNGSSLVQFPGNAFVDDYFNNGTASSTLKYVGGNPPFIGCSTNNGNGNNPINPISNQLILENIVQDQLPLVTNPSQTEKINKHQVYRLLKSNPDLMTGSTVLQDFYTNSQPTLRETFVSIETDLSQGDITTGANKVAFIAPQDNIETIYKNFYEAYIKQSTDSLNATDSLQLATIASGCPFTDGAVVYQARALYNVVYNSAVTFEDNCPTIAANSRLGNKQNNTAVIDKDGFDALVYPNPSNGNIFVAPIGKDVENIVITVTDITGKILYNEQTTVTTSFVNFNLNVKAGTYFVTIVNTHTNEKIIKKLIIQ